MAFLSHCGLLAILINMDSRLVTIKVQASTAKMLENYILIVTGTRRRLVFSHADEDDEDELSGADHFPRPPTLVLAALCFAPMAEHPDRVQPPDIRDEAN